MSTLTLILGGGRGVQLSVLAAARTKPALPFGGKYRLIDFTMSNIVHSGLDRVALLTQSNPQILLDHLGDGEPWGLKPGHFEVWQPSLERTGREQYVGTADAVYQNAPYIRAQNCQWVLILSGDHITCENFEELLYFHQMKGAALTISTIPAPLEDMQRFGILHVDENQQVRRFVEKPTAAPDPLQGFSLQASQGIYVFNTDFLLKRLEEDARDSDSRHDFGRDILPPLAGSGQVYARLSTQYWADIGTIESYWKANLALLGEQPVIDLYDPEWPILTRESRYAPTTIRMNGRVANSLVSDGCVIEGEVTHSVLSPGVRVERGAAVRNSVILNDAIVRAGAVITDCVVDREVEIGEGARIGGGEEMTPNQDEPALLNSGLTVIGKGAHIPNGMLIGRNCRIDLAVSAEDFQGMEVASGGSVRKGAK